MKRAVLTTCVLLTTVVAVVVAENRAQDSVYVDATQNGPQSNRPDCPPVRPGPSEDPSAGRARTSESVRESLEFTRAWTQEAGRREVDAARGRPSDGEELVATVTLPEPATLPELRAAAASEGVVPEVLYYGYAGETSYYTFEARHLRAGSQDVSDEQLVEQHLATLEDMEAQAARHASEDPDAQAAASVATNDIGLMRAHVGQHRSPPVIALQATTGLERAEALRDRLAADLGVVAQGCTPFGPVLPQAAVDSFVRGAQRSEQSPGPSLQGTDGEEQ